jgi:large subunit ribosomal protein L16
MLNLTPKYKVLKKKRKKGKINENLYVKDNLSFGKYGIASLNNCVVTLNELEAVRKLLVRKLREYNKGSKFKIWFRVFPHKMLTKKSKGSRMGKGKGALDCWVCPLHKGQVFLEIEGSFFNSLILKSFILNSFSKKLNFNITFFSLDSYFN